MVTVAGLVMAVPAVMFALWPAWPAAVAAAGILGLGYGVYLSVDQALVTQVLPSAAGRAKDLGIINIANSGPQVLAPAIAAPLVSQLGGYPTLYLTVAAVTVVGSAFVWKIRSVPWRSGERTGPLRYRVTPGPDRTRSNRARVPGPDPAGPGRGRPGPR